MIGVLTRPIARRAFLRGLAGLMGAGTAGALYARFGESQWLRVTRHVISIADPQGKGPSMRIVHLSDLHASPAVPFEFIAEAVTLALAQGPDVVTLMGDFFTHHLPDPERYAAILARLSAVAPTFACLGNHDGGAWARQTGGTPTVEGVLAMLENAGVTCLHNISRALTLRGRAVQFIGVGDLWSAMCSPAAAFEAAPPREGSGDQPLRVLLNHHPDAKGLLRPFDWDLMLCGHTHGGQVRLPLLGTPFAPVTDKRYVEGLHRWENRWLHVTRGVGNLHGLRFNCRPEISVLDVG